MSPLARSLLQSPAPVALDCSAEALDLLTDALLCSAEPTTLQAEPVVAWGDAGLPVGQVRICLNGLTWLVTATQALTAAGRLIETRTPVVARRQAYRFCWGELSQAARSAATNALAARHRGAH